LSRTLGSCVCFDGYFNDVGNPVLGDKVVAETVDDPGEISGARGKSLATVFFTHNKSYRLT